MLTTTLLLATLAVGIDTGYEPTPDGGLEYIIQIPPDVLQTLKPGEAITSEIPADLPGVQRYRIQVGAGQLPRVRPPEAIQTSAQTPIASPTAVQHQAALQSPDRKSPFEIGPTTNTFPANTAAPAATYPDDRYAPRAPAGNNSLLANSASMPQPNFPVADTELPLRLPPPPDGLDHLYNPPAANPTNPGFPNPAIPNNAYGNTNNPYPQGQGQLAANPYGAGQYPNYGYPNNFVGNNPYFQGQYPQGMANNFGVNPALGAFPNGAMPNTGMPMGAVPNNGFPNNNFPNGGFPNNGFQNGGFANNSSQGYGQGFPANQTAQDNRPAGTLASNTPTIRGEDSGRVTTYREEGSPGDVSARDRAKAEADAPKPWLPMYVTGLAAVGSLLGNLYLAWMWLETRRRYRQAIIERTLAV